jgi:hypothetical protein
MLTCTLPTPRALEIVCEGRVGADDVREAFARLDRLIETSPRIDCLADVRDGVHVDPTAIWEELKNLPAVARAVRALDRVALVADPAWVRAVGRIESRLIPGVDYRVFDRDGGAAARAWILREGEPPAAS